MYLDEESSEFDDMIEIHGSYLPILTGTVEGFLYLIFCLVSFLLGEFLIVLAHPVDLQELVHINGACFPWI